MTGKPTSLDQPVLYGRQGPGQPSRAYIQADNGTSGGKPVTMMHNNNNQR